MGFCNNAILFFFLLFILNTSLMNHICICKASNQNLCIPSERQALLNFKHHLFDPSNRLTSWSENTNCCNWTSVVCNNVSGHILQLHLKTSYDDYAEFESSERSWFGGEIDPSILALSYLSYLDLSGNNFWDMQIPSFLGSMKSLTYLNLSYAGLSGSIPRQIGNLSNLLHLDLGGKIPTGTQLQTLEADGFIGNVLCGPPLPNNCSDSKHVPKHDHNAKEGCP
ncbi:hypothetical protein QN277_001794 [Acacia crassicarpa]|uniref:Leucine-rich repeat-containing N-terminal plant-type domain-containing protein n=1 Tax=Acacia crassicarpa TaxID=499986 RepID=A0AAE1TH68_9FABA|nr:hypothetical protein QN277_001794 [Acacia crassicarpa]